MSKRLLWIVVLLAVGLVVQAQTDNPRPLYNLPGASEPVYTSSSIALTGDGRTLIAANMLNNTVSFVDVRQRVLLAEVPVGADPRTVAYTDDNLQALVVNRGDGTLSVLDVVEREVVATHSVGLLPYAVVPNPDGDQTAFVSLQGTSEVVEVDLTTGDILHRIPTPDFPSGLALWGDFLYVTHLWSGDLSLIYLPQRAVTRTVSTGQDTALSQSIFIDPRAGLAYLPQSRSNARNTALTFDSVVFSQVNIVDLGSMGLSRGARVNLDTADRPVNMPFAAVVDTARGWLYVVNAGSDDLSIIELNSGQRLWRTPVGANPRGILISRDNAFVYVHNMIDGTITFVETLNRRVSDILPVSDLRLPIDVFIGAQLFHSANDPRMSRDHWLSCASCHFDGQSDGRVWQGFPGGARNTPVLYGLGQTAPYSWTGDWDELADLEMKIRDLHAGLGLVEGDATQPLSDANAGLAIDLDALAAYLLTLPVYPSPFQADASAIEQGRAVFDAQGCAACHVGDDGSDGQSYDVGTGGMFDTPTLNWLWQSAPYFHDGRAADLQAVFTLPGAHQLVSRVSPQEINALVDYLRSLPHN